MLESGGKKKAALKVVIDLAEKGKATPGIDCAFHEGWMSPIELVETEAHHMEANVGLWLVVLFISSAGSVATFISCLCYSTCIFTFQLLFFKVHHNGGTVAFPQTTAEHTEAILMWHLL